MKTAFLVLALLAMIGPDVIDVIRLLDLTGDVMGCLVLLAVVVAMVMAPWLVEWEPAGQERRPVR